MNVKFKFVKETQMISVVLLYLQIFFVPLVDGLDWISCIIYACDWLVK